MQELYRATEGLYGDRSNYIGFDTVLCRVKSELHRNDMEICKVSLDYVGLYRDDIEFGFKLRKWRTEGCIIPCSKGMYAH